MNRIPNRKFDSKSNLEASQVPINNIYFTSFTLVTVLVICYYFAIVLVTVN